MLHVLLDYTTIIQVCPHLKIKALAQFVTTPLKPPCSWSGLGSINNNNKKQTLAHVVVGEKWREGGKRKEKKAFVVAAARCLIQGESSGKNTSLATAAPLTDRTTRREHERTGPISCPLLIQTLDDEELKRVAYRADRSALHSAWSSVLNVMWLNYDQLLLFCSH